MDPEPKRIPASRTAKIQIVPVPAAMLEVCTCGNKIAAGQKGFQVTGVPVSLETILGRRSFCSAACIRAFCLESLEMFDSMESTTSRTTVTDLHELNMDLAAALVALLG